jgi:hypothetical protein
MQVPLKVLETPGLFDAMRDRVYEYISPELEYNSRKFKIATDSKVGMNWGGYHKDKNPQGMREIQSEGDLSWLKS